MEVVKKLIASARDFKSKVIGNHQVTVLYQGDVVKFRYFDTDIVVISHDDRTVTIDDGGHNTNFTKRAIKAYLKSPFLDRLINTYKYNVIDNTIAKVYDGFKVTIFHRSRMAFTIIDGNVVFLEENSPLSHYEWLKLNYGLGKVAVNKLIRGYVHDDVIYFYTGRNFTTNEFLENKSLEFIDIIRDHCRMRVVKQVVGFGKHIGGLGEHWTPIKSVVIPYA